MPHKLRKTRKKRGTRTVGWGRVGQHRMTGQKGGRKVGRRKHLWSYVLRYEPNYFSKVGFHQPNRETPRTVNVEELGKIATKLTMKEEFMEKDGMPFIDLNALGYKKLLGSGKINKPFSIKVTSYSQQAAKKVEEAGGKITRE